MTPKPLSAIRAALLGVLVLFAVQWVGQLNHPLTIVPLPFGEYRVWGVYLLATLPLAWCAASRVPAIQAGGILGIVAGLAFALLPFSMMNAESGIWTSDRPDAVVLTGIMLHLCRVVFLLAPCLMWCYAWQQFYPEKGQTATFATLAAVLLLALVPTYLYATARHQAAQQRIQEYVASNRWWRAWQEVEIARAISGQDYALQRETLKNNFIIVAQREDIPSLLQLDRHEEVYKYLEQHSVPADRARHYRIELARREERWPAVIELIEQNPVKERDAETQGLLAAAYREVGRWSDAEQLYLQQIKDDPANAADWHLQLGKQYQIAGRPQLAIQHYTAASAAPKHKAEADNAIRELRASTPSCFFRY